MFTGIVRAIGTVSSMDAVGEDRRLTINTPVFDRGAFVLGESMCVSGVCLSIAELARDRLALDLSAETLARTTLGTLRAGDRVNLERSLTLASRVGGHLVTGHIDGVATVTARWPVGHSLGLRLQVPMDLCKYIAVKGSICVDGVSLTVNSVTRCDCEVNIIPHTLSNTTLGVVAAGQRVNIEVDLIARYLERLLRNGDESPAGTAITTALLAEHGFLR